MHAQGGRFDPREIAARVDRLIKVSGKTPKFIYETLKISKGNWSNKIHNIGTTFTIGELDEIATILNAPPGWPFLDDTMIAILERALAHPTPAPDFPNPPVASDAAQGRERKTRAK